jgi:DivIVA domain-containing protein
MNDNSDLLPNLTNLSHDDAFEVQLRGYSRRQVDEFLARCRSQIRELEQRLARSLDESEALRRDLAQARQQALGAKPAHEEVSERISQILKLADDEARSQKSKASDEISLLRNDAQSESDRVRGEAREQSERMLTAAQEQAERAITTARAEAEKVRNAARAEAERATSTARGEAERVTTTARSEAERLTTTARTEAERTTAEAQKKADNALATAKAQAKKALDEATARATAIHDGAERRLNHLSTRHSETIKRLTDILEGVSELVESENARPSLEDEVSQTAAKTIVNGDSASGHAQNSASPPPPGQLRAQGPVGPRQQAGQHRDTGGTMPGQGQGAAAGQAAAAQRQAQLNAQLQSHSKQGMAGTIDEDEQTEGIRIMPSHSGQ